MFGVGSTATGEWIRAEAKVAGADGVAYGIGLLAWAQPAAADQIEVVLEAQTGSRFGSSFGDISGPVTRLREAGILTATQVGALSDLDQANDAGVDVVVVRGAEGGGTAATRWALSRCCKWSLTAPHARSWPLEASSTIEVSLQYWRQAQRAPGSAPRSSGASRQACRHRLVHA